MKLPYFCCEQHQAVSSAADCVCRTSPIESAQEVALSVGAKAVAGYAHGKAEFEPIDSSLATDVQHREERCGPIIR